MILHECIYAGEHSITPLSGRDIRWSAVLDISNVLRQQEPNADTQTTQPCSPQTTQSCQGQAMSESVEGPQSIFEEEEAIEDRVAAQSCGVPEHHAGSDHQKVLADGGCV
jgi:hypothetical protein